MAFACAQMLHLFENIFMQMLAGKQICTSKKMCILKCNYVRRVLIFIDLIMLYLYIRNLCLRVPMYQYNIMMNYTSRDVRMTPFILIFNQLRMQSTIHIDS